MTDQEIVEKPIPRTSAPLRLDTLKIFFELCIKKPWLDSRQSELLDLCGLCQDLKEQVLVCELLHRFTYLTSREFKEDMFSIAKKVNEDWGFMPQNTLIVAINKTDYADSSESVLWHLKPAFSKFKGWVPNQFVSGAITSLSLVKSGSNVVLVDEFVGTGETITKLVKKFRDELEKRGVTDVKVKVCAATAMNFSKTRIESMNEEFFATRWLSQGITDYVKGEDLELAKSSMRRLEKELCNEDGSALPKKYSLGYKGSEALYHFESGNTPNNVFPIFWWKWLTEDRERSPLFNRL